MQELIEADAAERIGADPYVRTETRTTQRNGTRDKLVATTSGDLTVKIPKVRTGSFFPSLLAPRRRIDVALHAVVMQAWVEGVYTRKVDDLVAALGVESGISKSEVSRICAELDAEVHAWRSRPLDEIAFPYVFLDATYCKARVNGRVVSRAVVIATGVSANGCREVLGAGAPGVDLGVQLGADPGHLALAVPDSTPRAATRSSTLRVLTPSTQACITTACRATSMRRRGASSEGKNDPVRTLGIFTVRSPVAVASSLSRVPLR